jgi:hypothetical protein
MHVARSLPAISFLIIFGMQGLAQNSKEHGHAESAGTVSVRHVKQIRKDVDAWPLIVHPKNAEELRINATLANLNREFAGKVRDCLSGEFAWSKDSFDGGEWQRTVKVTMRGPRFLSMVAMDGMYCGDAYPDDDLVVLVFNLETGEPVDWSIGRQVGRGILIEG